MLHLLQNALPQAKPSRRSFLKMSAGAAGGRDDEDDEWLEVDLEDDGPGGADEGELAMPPDTMLLLTELRPEPPADGDKPRVAEVFKESPIGCEDMMRLP